MTQERDPNNPDNPAAFISDFDAQLIVKLSEAIGRAVGENIKKSEERSKISRGAGGLGRDPEVVKQLKEQALLYTHGKGADLGKGVAGALGGLFKSADVIAADYKDQRGHIVPNAQKIAMQRAALGLDPSHPNTMVDPTIFGGKMSMGQMLQMGANVIGNQSAKRINPSTGKPIFDSTTTRLNSAEALLSKSAEYAPVASRAYGLARRGYGGIQGFESVGASQGVSPAGGNLSIPSNVPIVGGMGFRFPVNAATIRGAENSVLTTALSARAGINKDQATSIRQQLFSTGYNDSSPEFARMQEGYAKVVNANPAMLNPITAGLYGGTRFQSSDEVNKLTDSLSRVGPAAAGARMNMDQLYNGMASYTTQAMQGGARGVGSAAQSYIGQLSATGVDPNILNKMQESPMIRAKFSQMGINPWAVQDATAGQKLQATTSGLKDMYAAYGGRGVDPGSAKGLDTLQRMVNTDPTLPSVPVLRHMLSLDPKTVQGYTAASQIASQYGDNAQTGVKKFADMSADERMSIVNQISENAGISDKQRGEFSKHIMDNPDTMESYVQAVVTAKASGNGQDYKNALSGGVDPLGNADVGQLLNKASEYLKNAAGKLSNKEASNSTGATPAQGG